MTTPDDIRALDTITASALRDAAAAQSALDVIRPIMAEMRARYRIYARARHRIQKALAALNATGR